MNTLRSSSSTPPSRQDMVDISEIIRILRRRMSLLVGVVVLITGITVLITFQLTPRYTAKASVMLEPRQTNVVDIESVISGLPVDQASILSEIEVLRSRSLAQRVIDKLALAQDAEFNPVLRSPAGLAAVKASLGAIAETIFSGTVDRDRQAVVPDPRRLRASIVDGLLGRLDIKPAGRSYVITISVESESPEKAADIVNSYADLYIVEQLEAKFEATRRANEWLSERLTVLRKDVLAAERAVALYKEQNDLVETNQSTVSGQQLGELNTQLTLASADRAEREARLRQVERLIGSESSAGINSATEVINSPLIQRLREQESEVRRKEAELATRYGERHPEMINVRAELRDLQGKIDEEIRKIAQALRNEVEVSRTRESSLRASVRQLEVQAGELNRKSVRLNELQREAQASRVLYENFLGRFKQTTEQSGVAQPDARIISLAEVPGAPSFPKKSLIIALALVASAGIGLVVILIVERLDNGFRSGDQIEQMTGVPALGLLPIPPGGRTRLSPEDQVIKTPNSAFSEAVRSLRTAVNLSNVDHPPQTVLITSALPGEGKTSVAFAMARLNALTAPDRTLIIDCDFRRPKLSDRFRGQAQKGLIHLLTHDATPEEAIRVDRDSGVHMIPIGGETTSPTELLGSKAMSELLQDLRTRYSLIVMDSPPLLAVADARVLSRIVDATVFVVRWEKTPRNVVAAALKQLQDIGAPVAGIVLNRVNARKHARYGYSDSGYYGRKYNKYYAS